MTEPLPEFEPYAEGLDRLKIPGGWMYRGIKGQTFVPASAVAEEARLQRLAKTMEDCFEKPNPMRNL